MMTIGEGWPIPSAAPPFSSKYNCKYILTFCVVYGTLISIEKGEGLAVVRNIS